MRSHSWLRMDAPQTTSAQTRPRPQLCSTRTQFLILTHRLTCPEGRGNNNSYHYCFGLEDPVERLVLRKAAGGQVSGIERMLPRFRCTDALFHGGGRQCICADGDEAETCPQAS